MTRPKTTLDDKLKKLDGIQKLQQIKSDKLKFEQEAEHRDLTNELVQLQCEEKRADKTMDEIRSITGAMETFMIDPDTPVGMDPKFKNAFTPAQLKVMADKVMQKIKKL